MENFERHNSTRWVRASVPSYGEAWGDDYDYGIEEEPQGEEGSLEEGTRSLISTDTYIRDEENTSNAGKINESHSDRPSDLILSIDRLKDRYSDSDDSDSSVDETKEVTGVQEEEQSGKENMNYDDFSNRGSVSEAVQGSDHIQPPTPSYSQTKFPETPLSERSFTDTDSIQAEPSNLNVLGDIASDKTHPVMNSTFYESDALDYEGESQKEGIPSTFIADNTSASNIPEDTEGEISREVAKNMDEEDMSGSDPKSRRLQEHTNMHIREEVNSGAFNEKDTTPENHVPTSNSHVNELDSLIKDLQSASLIQSDSHENPSHDEDSTIYDISLPRIPSLQGFDLPDLDEDVDSDTGVRRIDSDGSVVLKPLSIKKNIDSAGNIINERKISVRKPPPKFESSASDQEGSIRTYSGANDNLKNSSQYADLNSISETARGNKHVHNISNDSSDEDDPNIIPLQHIVSTGSLSTGRMSPPPTMSITNKSKDSDSNVDDDSLSRRESTISYNTINLGSWKPNTSNYRDQFINSNDNESHINFRGSDNNYSKFIKVRSASGVMYDNASRASSISMPDTVNVVLPQIKETNDHESFNHESETEKSLHSISSDRTSGSEVTYRRSSFQAENSVLESAESAMLESTVVDTHSSSSDITKENKRVASLGSSVSDKSSAVNKTKPQYSWKKILATSQSADRISLLKEALTEETSYDTGLQDWITATLKSSDNAPTIHIGKITTEAYQNAPHNDLRRLISIRSKVSIVKDKVETSGHQASSLGRKFFSKSKRFIKSGGD